MRRVIVPPAAGVFSAVGLLVAKQSVTLSAAYSGELTGSDVSVVNAHYGRLQQDAERLLNLSERAPIFRLEAEMRYVGQAFELTIPIGADVFSDAVKSRLRPLFDAEHERRFGHKFDETNAVEIVALKIHATDPEDQAPAKLVVPPVEPLHFERKVYFGETFGTIPTAVINRGALSNTPQQGPLIVEEFEGTTVIPPDAVAHRDESDNIVIDLEY